MPASKFAGLFVAVVTPFRVDGAVNFEMLERHLNWLAEEGVHGVMVAGTAGEYANLSDQERREIATQTVRTVGGRLPVIVHTGHTNRDSALELTRHAEREGADAVMLTPPAIVKPTQGEIEAYFREVAAAVSIDLVIYNNPTRVGVKTAVDTLLRLAEIPNISALKDSGRLMEETLEVINRAGDRMAVLSGEGDLFLPILAVGGTGGILTVPNILPRLHVELFEAFRRGDLARARLLNRDLLEFSKLLGSEGKYHSAIKAAMRQAGIPIGMPRRPLTDVSPALKSEIRKGLELLGLPLADPSVA